MKLGRNFIQPFLKGEISAIKLLWGFNKYYGNNMWFFEVTYGIYVEISDVGVSPLVGAVSTNTYILVMEGNWFIVGSNISNKLLI